MTYEEWLEQNQQFIKKYLKENMTTQVCIENNHKSARIDVNIILDGVDFDSYSDLIYFEQG